MSDKAARTRISLHLTTVYLDSLNRLVDDGLFLEQQDAIRTALRHYFLFHKIEPFCTEFVGEAEKVQD